MTPIARLSTGASAAAELVRAATAEAQAAKSAGSSARAAAALSVARSAYVPTAGLTRAKPASPTHRSIMTRSASGAGYAGASRSAAGTASSKASATKVSATKTSKAQASASDPLAFLHDPKLSVEEKLMRLLAHLNAQWEKDMQKKLDAFRGVSETGGGSKRGGASGSSQSTGASGTKGKSLLETVAGAAKQFLPAVGFALDALKNPAVRSVATKIGGPVLAAAASAMGFPALAPALLRYAPKVIDVAAGVASALDRNGSPAADGSGSGTTASSAAKAAGESPSGGSTMSASEQQLALMEIQQLQQKQKEMFGIVSNVMKSGHDLRMGVIANLR